MTIVTLISHLFPAINFKTDKSLHYFGLTANKDYNHVVKFLQDLLLCKMSALINGMHITSVLYVSTSKKLIYQQTMYLNNL